jgi:hypothetical protein
LPVKTEVITRPATSADAAICGRICYDAFAAINAQHNFPCDFPNRDVAVGLLTMMFNAPGLYAVVAEIDGRFVGSNVLDERSIVMGIGPITVDPEVQNAGANKMQPVSASCRPPSTTARSRSMPDSVSTCVSRSVASRARRPGAQSPVVTFGPLLPPMWTRAMRSPTGFMASIEAPTCRRPSIEAPPA